MRPGQHQAKKLHFQINIFHKKHMFDLGFLKNFKYAISFLLQFVEHPNIRSKENLLTFVAIPTVL